MNNQENNTFAVSSNSLADVLCLLPAGKESNVVINGVRVSKEERGYVVRQNGMEFIYDASSEVLADIHEDCIGSRNSYYANPQ